MPHATDLALARRVLAADPAAFEQLFERFYPCVLADVWRQLGDESWACGVTEASLKETLETLSDYDGTLPLAAFVLTITRREVARARLLRARARVPASAQPLLLPAEV